MCENGWGGLGGGVPIAICTTVGVSIWKPQDSRMKPGCCAMVERVSCQAVEASPESRLTSGLRGR